MLDEALEGTQNACGLGLLPFTIKISLIGN
jgi:hypothetical protein